MEGTLVRWYVRRDRRCDVVGAWLGVAREHLPDAVPHTYGTTEPLRERFVAGGEQTLRSAHATAADFLFLSGGPSVPDAALAAPVRGLSGRVGAHVLHTSRSPGDPAVRAFALEFACRVPTIYVSASAESAHTSDTAEVFPERTAEPEPYLAPLGRWLGLPPAPPVWCWFGSAYASSLRRSSLVTRPYGPGLCWDGDLAGPWVPERLRARLDELEPRRRRARRVPCGVR
ncbi:hypothetical protein [Rhodococcus gannanensis]|uniref:Uncharacterized protein n=1 Tax=Rhodococcus gannanensis TaxID=1960308 RepID=A0ABW4P4I5_9NOCA